LSAATNSYIVTSLWNSKIMIFQFLAAHIKLHQNILSKWKNSFLFFSSKLLCAANLVLCSLLDWRLCFLFNRHSFSLLKSNFVWNLILSLDCLSRYFILSNLFNDLSNLHDLIIFLKNWTLCECFVFKRIWLIHQLNLKKTLREIIQRFSQFHCLH
jgi:hypothetical protein